KIAQAERDAVNEVRARAVDVAVAAASKILSDKVDSPVSGTLFDESITQLKAKLN
ncbi:MAG: ATP F0F1 synthase subunit B, partial [Phyllobacteriaceae bacterium]|nr:ATP F0F1 synthase subunit B [Phyllobacteriaceae bacterium]